MYGLLELRVALQQLQRVAARHAQQLELLGDVGQLELRQAVLADAEELAGAAELQVHLGDLEAVGREAPRPRRVLRRPRSEEHTSELQSQSNLVCRLLLEKKKKHTH